jgi:hypothetical protein
VVLSGIAPFNFPATFQSDVERLLAPDSTHRKRLSVLTFVHLQKRQKRFLRNLDATDFFHSFFAFFLFFEQFAFSADIIFVL